MKIRLLIAACAALVIPLSLRAQSATPTPTPAPDYINQVRGGGDANAAAAAFIVSTMPQIAGIDFQAISRVSFMLWHDTAQTQAIVDKMGEKAAPVFVTYGLLAGPLSTIDPVAYAKLAKPPAGYGWTIMPPQADGTWLAGQRSVTIITPPAAH